MATPLVYFARAVDGLERAGLIAGAEMIGSELREFGMRMIDPVSTWMQAVEGKPASDDPAGLVESDLGLLRRSDGVLMDMSIKDRNYIGCTCELTYAHLWRIPSVVWVGDTGLEQRPWLRYHATVLVNSRQEAIRAVAGLLLH
ncbi:hypothetical protein KOI35_20920 [Actinoplanes bogorensis]|uniref:Nucleoside 2-deoxyribosyltransferase n=1 Tax=Paractinoplanes bogorensis TaxID=1610840 RepID=A0ABS5YRH5_9ACTN|nr:hypothetical protein [Actinoplanes bogorensis]MBU2665978.1 hypothetical protein [Actinoplanes bogorensis]